MAEKQSIHLNGSIFGVSFNVTITHDLDEDAFTIVGQTNHAHGSLPLSIGVAVDEESGTLDVSGTALGNEISIFGSKS